jgi:hypothetical protein
MAFTDRADEVLAKLRTEMAQPVSMRRSGAADAQLRFALDKVEQMKREVVEGTLPPRHLRYQELGRAIVDGWALGSPVGAAVIELEKEYRSI